MQKLYRFWLVLVAISAGVALIFLGWACMDLWKFVRFDTQVEARIERFDVKKASSRYALEVHYSYEVQGSSYEGKAMLEKPLFLSRSSAEQYGVFQKTRKWKAWHVKSSPGQSTLEHKFPQRRCLYALITLCVFLYFFFAKGLLEKYMAILPQKK